MTIAKLITDFLEYLEVERGRAILTAQNYDRYLQTFAAFAKENKVIDPKDISADLIVKYRLGLNRGFGKTDARQLSKKTQNYYLIALRSFLKFLAKKNIQTFAPEQIELAKTDERQITFLDDDELDKLLKQPDLTTMQGRRDRAILDLLFSTGLRVSELCQLKKTDINLEKSEFSVKGKGGKIRVVFVDHEAKESLKRYLDFRPDKSDYLFASYGHTKYADGLRLTADGKKPMTPRSVQRMVAKYAIAGGITKHVTPHVMRHSFATDLLMSGGDLRSVQALLGHSSVNTTQIYTHVTDKHLREVHEAFHGLRRGKKEIIK